MKLFDAILVLAPHTDDGELGCGGTMDRLVKSGTDVHYAAFSTAEKSVPTGYPADILKNEGLKKQLGMSLPEVTLTECNELSPRRSKKKRKIIANTLT